MSAVCVEVNPVGRIRIGIIGFGHIGRLHAGYLLNGKVAGAELTAVCDLDSAVLNTQLEGDRDFRRFTDTNELFGAKVVDAVIIATPHYSHPQLAIDAIRQDLHVLVEKPAGVCTRQVRQLNEVASQSEVVFSITLYRRLHSLYQTIRELVHSPNIGALKRNSWIITEWYRAQSYYDQHPWRGTWAGEGGGVLLNQATHQLDLYQWIFGMPKRVKAFCHFGKYHKIEVEDDVTAYVEYENGATGTFVTSTGETPGTNRLELIGDRGKLVVEDEKITLWRLRVPERQFNRDYRGDFGEPEAERVELSMTGMRPILADITQNWVDAIRGQAKLAVPGQEGIRAIEFSNAMILSTWLDDWVSFPVDEELFLSTMKERTGHTV